MTTQDSCPRCNASPEDINHLFRACFKAVDLWGATAFGQIMRGNLDSSIVVWFGKNLQKSKLIELNVDGCWYSAKRNAGIGRIFRDTKGTWILGFYGKLNAESSTTVEIWSIYRGLTIILEKGLVNVDIESDSLVVVNLVNEGNPGNHP
ncbi:hypothetical protein RHGRI_014428 [Rhododendron griersonianum]|uniref:RNase H type-1 domain-containing protein n=1 Tax=Rhododendron griersonianum TaxID=479676 RepID=A0AAV6K9A7_9ERIC|nr:hypothetical protein RHGRI_014428 [Rhododendron griersonianum]